MKTGFDNKKYVNITDDRYIKLFPHTSEDVDVIDGDSNVVDTVKNYAAVKSTLGQYLSPVRQVLTTLGQATVKPENGNIKVKDIYDFAGREANVYKKYVDLEGKTRYHDIRNGDEYDDTYDPDEDVFKKYLNKTLEYNNTPYGRIRVIAQRLGHGETDSDKGKIKTSISIDDVKKRLGGKLWKYDVTKPMTRAELVLRSAGSGAITGAPIGAVLGALSGAMLLIDKKKRKNWVKTMLYNILGGAAISAALGAAGLGIASNHAYSMFEKNSEDKHEKKNKRMDKIKSAIIHSLAYSLPVLAVAGSGFYGAKKIYGMKDVFGKPRAEDYVSIENA